jgi:pimeloyl-ACP methyl ester carboxylesterase
MRSKLKWLWATMLLGSFVALPFAVRMFAKPDIQKTTGYVAGIYYELYSSQHSRPRLLYIAGSQADCRVLNRDLVLHEYTAHFDLLIYDHRGFGQSAGIPENATTYSMHAYAKDALALLSHIWAPSQKANLSVLGHSFGGE